MRTHLFKLPRSHPTRIALVIAAVLLAGGASWAAAPTAAACPEPDSPADALFYFHRGQPPAGSEGFIVLDKTQVHEFVVHLRRDSSGSWHGLAAPVPSSGSIVAPCEISGRSVEQVRSRLRQHLQESLGEDAPLNLLCEVEVPPEIEENLQTYKALQRRIEANKVQAERIMVDVVKGLTGSYGYSTRDTAKVVGFSHEQVNQLRKRET